MPLNASALWGEVEEVGSESLSPSLGPAQGVGPSSTTGAVNELQYLQARLQEGGAGLR